MIRLELKKLEYKTDELCGLLNTVLTANVGNVVGLFDDRRLCKTKAVFLPVLALMDAFPEDLLNQVLGIGAVDLDGIPNGLVVHRHDGE